MRSREEYDELLVGFRALRVQVGRRLFDLRWHRLSGIPHSCSPHKDGGWADIEWKGVPVENWPFDPGKREVVGLLCLPMDDKSERFTLGFDVVTLPRRGSAAESLTVGEGTVGEGFRRLSARAGAASHTSGANTFAGIVQCSTTRRQRSSGMLCCLPFAAMPWLRMVVVVMVTNLNCPIRCSAQWTSSNGWA